MRQEQFHYKDDDYDVAITVRQADVRAGVLRSTILGEQFRAFRKAEEEHPDQPPNIIERAIATLTYPACIAAVLKIENTDLNKPAKLQLPLTLEQFMALPDALAYLWEEAALHVNPHWAPRAPAGEGKEPSTETNLGVV